MNLKQAMPRDRFDLQRFMNAQTPIYTTALGELLRGKKRTHWMWFIFRQAEGLGTSEMAQLYAIRSRVEANAYLAHPLLGVRLLECTETVLQHTSRSANEIFGSPDDIKFRSCMTLFDLARGGPSFEDALDLFYQGQRDEMTSQIYSSWKTNYLGGAVNKFPQGLADATASSSHKGAGWDCLGSTSPLPSSQHFALRLGQFGLQPVAFGAKTVDLIQHS